MIAPGRYADILLVTDLVNFQPDVVIARGQVVAEAGQLAMELPSIQYPDWALRSIHLQRPMVAEDFKLACSPGKVTANVIGVVENQAPTRHLHIQLDVKNQEVRPDLEWDLAKVALVERHRGSGEVRVGLVHGFGFKVPCAVASTVAHDSHQMIVVGTDENSMAVAANRLAACGGGQVVVRRGKVIGQVELPVAGLISNERAQSVAQKAETVLQGFRACGCDLNNPNMQLSLLGLVVIPELRISDKGLVDVNEFKVLPVFE
jgi:adenine deaminase